MPIHFQRAPVKPSEGHSNLNVWLNSIDSQQYEEVVLQFDLQH